MFGEANHQIQSLRYACSVEDVINLAGLQLQTVGNYDPIRHPAGYLCKGDRWHFVVPTAIRKQLKPAVWEQRIMESYKSHKGKSQRAARIR